jgi:N-acyl-D-aspartate/D-glutamate deacylase
VVELISDFWPDPEAEFTMIRRLVELAGCPLSVSLAQSHQRPGAWRELLAQIAEAAAEGLPIRGQVAPRPIGLLLGLQSSFHPFSGNPVFREIAGEPLEAQVRALRDAAFRDRLLADERQGGPGRRFVDPSRMFPLGDVPDYEPAAETSVQRMAEARGIEPGAMTIDLLTENGGRNFLLVPFSNYADGDLNACGEMLTHPDTLMGLGDGGAHVGIISDASFPTYALSHWTRDRSHGRMAVGSMVARLTSANARAVGLTDRGVVAEGKRADLNVIDFDHLRCEVPVMAYDLPAGGKRLLQRSRGYRATIVGGDVTYRDGEPTGALPGRLVRGGAPAAR